VSKEGDTFQVEFKVSDRCGETVTVSVSITVQYVADDTTTTTTTTDPTTQKPDDGNDDKTEPTTTSTTDVTYTVRAIPSKCV